MIGKLFGSNARETILKLFLLNPDNKYYLRQISALTGLPIQAVQREIKNLENIRLIEKNFHGKQAFFNANRKNPIFKELKGIFFKTTGIPEILKISLLRNDGNITTAFIYGSYAKQSETLSSDIDLMVIGKIGLKALSAVLSSAKKEIEREINYSVFTENEFREKTGKNDHFLTSVLAGPKIFLIGDNIGLKAIIK